MINETKEATEIINNHSDHKTNSMSLSGQGANIDLDQQTTPTTPVKTEPPKKTQGEYQTELNDYNRQIEDYNNWLDWLLNDYNLISGNKEQARKQEDFIKMLGISKEEASRIAGSNKDWGKAEFHKMINEMLSKAYQGKENITYNSDYDPRPYDQRREDTATQRKVEDYTAAGLNKAAVSGFYGGGGGGGGSSGSSGDDEEEKRKRREKAKAEAQARKEAARQKNIDRTLGIIKEVGNIGGRFGGQMLMANAWGKRAEAQIKSANIGAKNRLETEILKDQLKRGKFNNQNTPAWLDEILNEL